MVYKSLRFLLPLLALVFVFPTQASPAAQTTDCTSVTEIPVTECQALMALYNSTNGPGWTNHTGWGTTNTPCSWYGGVCSGGHVAMLTLSGDKLSGNIPPELGNLTSLWFLDLTTNQLSGSIPPELGSLTGLQVLNLSANQLSGSIPPELGSLTSLEILSLSLNQLSGSIPSTLANLTNLISTNLGYNMLTASGEALLAFLAVKDPDWAATQTVPPADVQYGCSAIHWTPITYTSDGGYYVVSYATTPDGPYTIAGQTVDKTVSSFTVAGLNPNPTYYFVGQSYTPAHGYQKNNLLSAYSAVASATISTENAILQRWCFMTKMPTLTWNRVSWASRYEVQVAKSSSFPTNALVYTKADVPAGELSVTIDTPPLDDGTYYWRARAIRTNGTAGAWSAVDSFVVDAP